MTNPERANTLAVSFRNHLIPVVCSCRGPAAVIGPAADATPPEPSPPQRKSPPFPAAPQQSPVKHPGTRRPANPFSFGSAFTRARTGGAVRLMAFAAVVLGVALAVEGGGAAPWRIGSPRAPEAVLLSQRFTAGRLSGQHAWQPCVAEPAEALVARVRCAAPLRRGTRRYRHFSAAASSLHRRLPAGDSAARLRASALWQLRRGGEAETAVATLERAAARWPHDARVLNDLAVAYLEQGARNQTLEPLLRALDAVERAAARDSTMPEVLYNRALVAERLYLVNTARQAWLRYANLERNAAWRGDAGAHLRRLARWPVEPVPFRALADRIVAGQEPALAELTGAVHRHPDQARAFALKALGDWGEAALAPDPRRAAGLLKAVGHLSRELSAAGTDRSAMLAFADIGRASGNPEQTAALATGWRWFDRGLEEMDASRYADCAASMARSARALETLSEAGARWSSFFHALCLIQSSRFSQADTILAGVLAQAAPGEAVLAGRSLWLRGTARVRQAQYDEASAFYTAARAPLARAGEREYSGAISYLLSESLHLAGQGVAARAEAFRGMRSLSRFPRSTSYNNQLSTVVAMAKAARLPYAALAVRNEVLQVSLATGKPEYPVWALRARAADRLALGDTALARADVAAAMMHARRVPEGPLRGRVEADVAFVRAQVEADADPAAALRIYREVVATLRQQRLGVLLPRALYEAGRTAARLNDTTTALAYLDSAVVQIEAVQVALLGAESRATHLETAENVFDAIIGLELAAGRPERAFSYLERGRLAAWTRGDLSRPGSRETPAPPRLAEVARALPEGMALLDYAVLRDRIGIWIVTRGRLRQVSVAVPRDSLRALTRALASHAPPDGTDSDPYARLYDRLVRPIERELAGVRQLTVVPDRELNEVAFAALRDASRQRRLMDSFEVRMAPNAAFFIAARRHAAARVVAGSRMLVVGDPALDPGLRLEPLRGAAAEAEAVARLNPGSTLLTGPRAGRDRVLALLAQSTVFHFAGHAVYNVDQPERSFLALAPDRPGATGVLHAWEIGRMRPTNLRVVVLSACSTLNPRPSRAGATTGLAYSFLRAGVPATVSTLWDVSDRETSSLLAEFHRRIAAGESVPSALRNTQLAAARSPDPRQNDPGTWAAFIYTGP